MIGLFALPAFGDNDGGKHDKGGDNECPVGLVNGMSPGIEYTTAGLTSIAGFQALGYQYIQP